MSLARVQFFSISLDGFGTGEGLSHDAPFGHAGERLHGGCSSPGGGTRWSASPAGQAASTTPSCGCTMSGWAPRSWVPGSSARPDGTRTRSGRAGGVPTRRSTHRPSSSPTTRARRSRWRAADLPLPRRLACRGARDGPQGRGRPGRPHRRGSHRDPRLPCRRARRPPAYRGGPDPARPRRTPLGRTGRPREGLRGRGHLLAQRSHACDVHPCGWLNRLVENPGRSRVASGTVDKGLSRHLALHPFSVHGVQAVAQVVVVAGEQVAVRSSTKLTEVCPALAATSSGEAPTAIHGATAVARSWMRGSVS